MEKKKIYLETTLFNYYFDTNKKGHVETVMLFKACAAGRFEPYTSSDVIEELKKAPCEKYDKMFDLIELYNITILDPSADVNKLARRYISEGALPKGSLTDAIHIATASIYELDKIISLNFRHIVRKKTIELTNKINTLLGYKTVEIHSPKEAMDNEKN